MDARIHIARQLRETCLLHGEFVLRSGAKSDVYFDKYRLLSHPSLFGRVVEVMESHLSWSHDRRLATAGFCATAIGGALFRMGMPLVIVRPEQKDHGTQNRVEGLVEGRGRDVVIIEDVVTSGGSVIETADALIEAGLQPIHVVALLDREQGGAERIMSALPGVSYRSVFTLSEILAA